MREAAQRLVDLALPAFPLVLSNQAPVEKRLAAGLVARILGSAEAAITLTQLQRRTDQAVIERSLFEHVIMLGWITGSASEQRIARWQAEDELNRGKLDREVSLLRAAPVLTDENRARVDQVKAQLGRNRNPLPSLADRAKVMDQEWGPRFNFAGQAGPTETRSFYSMRAAYSVLYRFASAAAHPTLTGLNFVVERTDTHTVIQVEPRTDVVPTFGLTCALVGAALYVSSDVLGSPRVTDINQVFDWLSRQPSSKAFPLGPDRTGRGSAC